MAPVYSKKDQERGCNDLLGLTATLSALVTKVIAIKLLWLWFLVPLGVMDINFGHAFGIVLLVRMIIIEKPVYSDGKYIEMMKAFTMASTYALAILLGFIIQLAM